VRGWTEKRNKIQNIVTFQHFVVGWSPHKCVHTYVEKDKGAIQLCELEWTPSTLMLLNMIFPYVCRVLLSHHVTITPKALHYIQENEF